MINFRRSWCKSAKKGSWWYKLLDCQRYEPAPEPPTPPIPPVPPVPPPPPPPPPVIPKTDIPYHKTGKLLIYSGFMLCDLCTKDNLLFKEEYLPAYYDELAKDGVNAIRSFLATFDGTPNWPTYNGHEPDHLDMLRRRLKMIKDRDLTAIVSLKPYGGSLSWDDYRVLIHLCLEFAPNVIFEPINEPMENSFQAQVYGILKNEFHVEDRFIQFNWVDSSDFKASMVAMQGRGLASCHGVATMETINAPYPMGWAGSSGTMELMSLGMGGSNDGKDAAGASQGAYFYGLSPDSRRPNLVQLKDCATWMLQNGKAYEHLSALAFAKQEEPDIRAITEYGRDERKMFRAALGY